MSCYVKLNFPSDITELDVVGAPPDKLPEPYPAIPERHDRIIFPKHLSRTNGTPAVFVVADRWFTALPDGVLRCDLLLAFEESITIDHW